MLWVENPITGSFVPIDAHVAGSKKPMIQATKRNDKANTVSDEDKNLENYPLIPRLDGDDVGTGAEKILFVPPPAPRLKDINDVYGADQWTKVTMEYRNFAFVKRCSFLIFQVFHGGDYSMELF